jgi:predicted RNA binding protein with dsRBD fold (UPF0201 family)
MSIDKEKVASAIGVLMSQLNIMGGADAVGQTIAEVVAKEHRTLQQNFWRSIRDTAIKYTQITDARGFDLRNEGAVGFCANVAKDETCMPYV